MRIHMTKFDVQTFVFYTTSKSQQNYSKFSPTMNCRYVHVVSCNASIQVKLCPQKAVVEFANKDL